MSSDDGSRGDNPAGEDPEDRFGIADRGASRSVAASYSRRWARGAWFLTGALLSFGLVSSVFVGLIVVVLGVALTLFTARRVGPLGVGAAMIGISTTPIVVGLISWGTSRADCSSPEAGCRSSSAAASWLLLGVVFASVGLGMLAVERRRMG